MAADTGAVIVAHDRVDYASVSLRNVCRELDPRNVVLVLNAPDHADPGALADIGTRVRVVSPHAPHGYGANLNLGVRSLPPGLTFALLANDDVDFEDGSVAALVARLRADERVGAAGPRLRDETGAPVDSAAVFPTALDAVVRSAVPSRLTRPLERIAQRHRGQQAPARTHPVDWIVGAALAVRLAAFDGVGGFDEDFFLYFEETDFCYRLWQNGWKVVSSPEVSFIHLQGRSTGDDRYRRMLHEGRRRFLVKRLGRARWTLLEPILVGAFGVTALWILAAGVLRPGTLARRRSLVRSRWRTRMFLTRLP